MIEGLRIEGIALPGVVVDRAKGHALRMRKAHANMLCRRAWSLGVLRNRNIELLEIVEEGNRVAWTGIWSASIGMDGLPIPKGRVVRVHMAAFTEVEDGIIIRHREYHTTPQEAGA